MWASGSDSDSEFEFRESEWVPRISQGRSVTVSQCRSSRTEPAIAGLISAASDKTVPEEAPSRKLN